MGIGDGESQTFGHIHHGGMDFCNRRLYPFLLSLARHKTTTCGHVFITVWTGYLQQAAIWLPCSSETGCEPTYFVKYQNVQVITMRSTKSASQSY